MDLDGIAIFVKVLQAGSFSRAAKLLGMPNSTVSAKVSALEKRLGVTLLQRTTRKLRATQAGEAYYQRSLRALEELQAAENELETGRAEPQGILRLTAPVEIGHSVLPALGHAYLKNHPRMKVELIVTNRVLDLIVDGIDLAIRAGPLKDSSLIAKRFDLGYFGLWASPEYLAKHAAPRHPKELAQHNYLRSSRFKDNGFPLTNGKENFSPTISGQLVADDFETLRSLAVRRGHRVPAEFSLRRRSEAARTCPGVTAVARRQGDPVARLSRAKVRFPKGPGVYRHGGRNVE